MNRTIRFPNLGIELDNVGKSITVLGIEIAFYGIIIALGMVTGVLLAEREAKITGQNKDDYTDFAIFGIIAAIVGARIFYIIFAWDNYKNNLLSIFNIREGGLAIYGGIIGAVITLYVFSKIRKLSFWQMTDTACIGLMAGQIIGRWGNFFNREVFGGYTEGIFAMQLPLDAVRRSDLTSQIMDNIKIVSGVEYIQVHPTFLYESLWNLGLLFFVLWYKKYKRFQGELFGIYIIGYGIGRAWIEGIRTDQLLLPFFDLPVSQVLSLALVIISAAIIIRKHRKLEKEKGQSEE